MAGKTTPIANEFISENIKLRLTKTGAIRLSSYQYLFLYENRPVYFSCYA